MVGLRKIPVKPSKPWVPKERIGILDKIEEIKKYFPVSVREERGRLPYEGLAYIKTRYYVKGEMIAEVTQYSNGEVDQWMTSYGERLYSTVPGVVKDEGK